MNALAILQKEYEIELSGSDLVLTKKAGVSTDPAIITEAIAQISKHKVNVLYVLRKPELKYKIILAMDIETTHVRPQQGVIRMFSIYGEDFQLVSEDLDKVRHLLNDPQVLKVFHNAAFDVTWLRIHGYEVVSYTDTYIMSQIIQNHAKKGHSLKDLAQTKLGMELNKSYQHAANWTGEITEEHKQYALMDAKATYELYLEFERIIKEKHLDIVLDRELKAMDAVIELRMNGMIFDYDGWEKELKIMEEESNQLLDTIRTTLSSPSLNVQSHQQLKQALHAYGIPVEGTADEVLAKFEDQYEVIKVLRRYKKLRKQLNSFGDKLKNAIDNDGRLRGDWKLCGTDTFRMTCKEPNLQGMPGISKPYFKAKDGYSFVVADYSTIELRILAEISKDMELLNAFQNGEDLHEKTAAFVFGKGRDESITPNERKVGKIINFGLVYGMTKWGLQKKINAAIEGSVELHEAEAFRTRYFELYRGVSDYQDQMLKSDIIHTLGGRYWSVDHNMLPEGTIARFNYPIQATCAEGLKEALALFLKGRKPSWQLVAVVHDEVVLEVPNNEISQASQFLKKTMIGGMGSIVKQIPIEVEIKSAKHWVK